MFYKIDLLVLVGLAPKGYLVSQRRKRRDVHSHSKPWLLLVIWPGVSNQNPCFVVLIMRVTTVFLTMSWCSVCMTDGMTWWQWSEEGECTKHRNHSHINEYDHIVLPCMDLGVVCCPMSVRTTAGRCSHSQLVGHGHLVVSRRGYRYQIIKKRWRSRQILADSLPDEWYATCYD